VTINKNQRISTSYYNPPTAKYNKKIENNEVNEAPVSDEDIYLGDESELGLGELEEGAAQPAPISKQEFLEHLQAVKDLLAQHHKALPASWVKQITVRLKELTSLIKKLSNSELIDETITLELDQIEINVLEAGSKNLKEVYTQAEQALDELQFKIEADSMIEDTAKEEFLVLLKEQSELLIKDPLYALSLLGEEGAYQSIEKDYALAREERYSEDTKPSRVNGSKATYQVEEGEVILTLNFEDAIDGHEIIGADKVILRPQDSEDIFSYEYNPDNHLYTIAVKGKNQRSETITIQGTKETEVVFEVKDEKKVELPEGETGRVQIAGNTSYLASLHSSLAQLAEKTGMSSDDLLDKLYEYFPKLDIDQDGKILTHEANTAIKKGEFPPKEPDNNLLQFLVSIDYSLQEMLMDNYDWIEVDGSGNRTGGNGGEIDKVYSAIRDRAVELLTILYEGSGTIVKSSERTGYGDSDDILINGKATDIIHQEAANQEGYRLSEKDFENMARKILQINS